MAYVTWKNHVFPESTLYYALTPDKLRKEFLLLFFSWITRVFSFIWHYNSKKYYINGFLKNTLSPGEIFSFIHCLSLSERCNIANVFWLWFQISPIFSVYIISFLVCDVWILATQDWYRKFWEQCSQSQHRFISPHTTSNMQVSLMRFFGNEENSFLQIINRQLLV